MARHTPSKSPPADVPQHTYGFLLRLPADYTVTEAPNANARAENGTADIIDFADKSGTVGIQLSVGPSKVQ